MSETEAEVTATVIGNTLYRPEAAHDGSMVLRDAWGDPVPGDPDGDWRKRANQLARGHRMQHMEGWTYRSTAGYVGEPFDPDAPPPGDGWELNTYAGEAGHGTSETASGQTQNVSYWRRRTTKP